MTCDLNLCIALADKVVQSFHDISQNKVKQHLCNPRVEARKLRCQLKFQVRQPKAGERLEMRINSEMPVVLYPVIACQKLQLGIATFSCHEFHWQLELSDDPTLYNYF